jgi:signal transduction histidine kinase
MTGQERVSAAPRIVPEAQVARPNAVRSVARDAEDRLIGTRALRVPLVIKLIGAHLLSLALVIGALFAVAGTRVGAGIVIGVAVLATLLFASLAAVALLPLREIEAVASRVWRGDFGARVDSSPVADRNIKRIGNTFNLLLDGLIADRSRVQTLASSIIDAGDRERAHLARELHDSTAQQLAALVLQLSAAARDCTDEALAERLTEMRDQASEALEEVRLLAHTVHPRVLDDLGLAAALQKLGREASTAGHVEFEVRSDLDGLVIPPTPAAVLYRVAQSAVHNVLKHAAADRAELRLAARDGNVVLDVIDDGRGFDVVEAERRRPGMGLFTMRERVALAGGRFEIHSTPGVGTRVSASLPIRGFFTASQKETSNDR